MQETFQHRNRPPTTNLGAYVSSASLPFLSLRAPTERYSLLTSTPMNKRHTTLLRHRHNMLSTIILLTNPNILPLSIENDIRSSQKGGTQYESLLNTRTSPHSQKACSFDVVVVDFNDEVGIRDVNSLDITFAGAAAKCEVDGAERGFAGNGETKVFSIED